MTRIKIVLLLVVVIVSIGAVTAADPVVPVTTVPAPGLAGSGQESPALGPAVRGTVTTLPIVITTPGTYTLDRDYTNLAGLVAIDIRCSNVVIDGAGHTLDGVDAANSVGIQAHGSAAVTGVTVRNIRLTDWSKGIYFWNARGRIESVTASSNTGSGFMLYTGGDATVITGCTAESNGIGGFSISYAPGVELSSSSARNNVNDGVYIYASNDVRITGVTATGNTMSGVALSGSSTSRITGVRVSGCQVTANGKAGIYMSRAEANTVVNNRIENTRNVLFEGAEVGANTWNTAKTAGTNIAGGPYLGGNWWSGFSETAADGDRDGLADAAYAIGSGNTDALPLVSPSSPGTVYSGMVITAPGTYTLDRDLQDEGHAVVVEVRSSNVVIEGNGHRISGSGQSQYAGIYVNNPAGAVTGLTIRDLTILNCHYGIYLTNTDSGLVERCHVLDTPSNGMGLILYQGSNGNTVAGNRIRAAPSAGSSTYGIVISSSSQNTVVNNELNNPINAYLPGTLGPNTWNMAKTAGTNIVGGPYLGGNYWAEPDGSGWSQVATDANNDGIGDSAYYLAAGNSDFLPLVSIPVAGFTAVPTSGSAPLTVQFTDASTGSPTSWSWSFGDGYTSTSRNPAHTYYTTGIYTVSLTVWNAAGRSDTETRYDLIRVTTPPYPTSVNLNYGVRGYTAGVANLAGTNFEPGAMVRLTRAGYSDLYATNVNVISSTKIACQFAIPSTAATGAWNVVVTNPDGQSGTLSSGFTIRAAVPLADAVDAPQLAWNTYGGASWMGSGGTTHDGVDAAQSGAIGHSASSSLSTSVTGPATVSFYWKVSSENTYDRLALTIDGVETRAISGEVGWRYESVAVGTGPRTLAWTYSKDGSVTAGGDAGWVDQVTVTATPVADFTAWPTSGTAPLSVQFTDASTGSPTSWAWSFGDDNISTSRNPIYTYTAAGTYTVSLTVWNDAGQSDSETRYSLITVVPPPPTVTSVTPNTGTQGSTVTITNLAGTGFRYGATVKLTRPGSAEIAATNVAVVSSTRITCQFALPSTAAPGAWTVVVTNPDGQQGTLNGGFTVTTPPVIADFTAWPTSGTAPLSVQFTDASTGSATSWLWSFGDGATSTLRNPSHTYSTAGTYTVSLTAQNAGSTDTETKVSLITVVWPPPTVTAITPNAGTAGSSIAITNLAGTGFRNGATVRLTRTGSAEIAATNVAVVSSKITCQFALPSTAAPGAWNVAVTNPDGQAGTLTSGFTVMPIPVIANFTASPTSGTAPLTVQFTDASSGSPTSWSWSFGDGATSTLRNPAHTYTAAGTYTVSLTAWNAAGQSDSETRTGLITVQNAPPIILETGEFRVQGVGGTVEVPVVLTSAPGGLAGYRFTVSLGDPSVATITGVTFPEWASLKSSSSLPSGQVVLQGVDLSQQVPVGATNVVLVTLTVKGTATGSTSIVVTPDQSMGIQNREGNLYPITAPPGTLTVASAPVLPVPPSTLPPTDTNDDGLYDDVNGNGRQDFADVVLYFNQMSWIAANEPIALFDYNANGRVDFADVVWLFNHL